MRIRGRLGAPVDLFGGWFFFGDDGVLEGRSGLFVERVVFVFDDVIIIDHYVM